MKLNLTQAAQHNFGTGTTGKIKTMDTEKDWISSFASSTFGQEDVTELSRTFDSTITHGGLLQYAHYCWAKEMGMVLRPDMLWYTIVSEFSQQVLKNPDVYKYLFNKLEGKTDINQLVKNETDYDFEKLTQQLEKRVPNKAFLKLICGTRFQSEAPNANLAVKMIFSCMATPYYNYMSTQCGISKIDVQGSKEDWITLYNSVAKLYHYSPGITDTSCEDKHNRRVKSHQQYVLRVTNLVSNILFFTFGIKKKVLAPIDGCTNQQQFFDNIFHYGRPERCESGHDQFNVNGWLKNFYYESNDKLKGSTDLHKYSCHISYVPYANKESGRNFYQATGLVYSNIMDGFLDPQYGFVKHEIKNNKLYEYLAKTTNEDPNSASKYQNYGSSVNIITIMQGMKGIKYSK